MKHLERIQSDFQSFMLRGDAGIEAHVVATQPVPLDVRLGVYGGGYRSRLIEALEANFPVLAQLLGSDDFAALGAAYVADHVSEFASIRYYGRELPQLLQVHPDYSSVPALTELARWEWAMTEVFDAADAAPIEVEVLGSVQPAAWADLRFDVHPSVRRLDLAWNVPQVWKAVSGETQPPPPAGPVEFVPWLLWRHGIDIFFKSLGVADAAAFDAARAGRPFGEICVVLCSHFDEAQAPAEAAQNLRDWVGSGLITGVRTA